MTISTIYTQSLRQNSRKRNQKYSFTVILKNLRIQNFQFKLINKFNSRNACEYCTFEKNFVEVLDKHAPKQRKIFLVNQKPHINKTLRSAIMKRSY